ncbi:MAG: hypothetical protein R3B09_00355 [Nannocystaceae bacterium]
MLASSTRLPARESVLITRLSDLSGTLAGAPNFDSYLSLYPVYSSGFYAVAKTWLDATASRSGCVLTHTLLVPASIWTTLEHPRALELLFKEPSESTRTLEDYCVALELPSIPRAPSVSSLEDVDQGRLLAFLRSYFGMGIRPMIWFGQKHSDLVLWNVVGKLWPKLRMCFSACTMCLQPRFLDDRPFDLMFAPSTVSSRFQKFSQSHYVNQSTPDVLRGSNRDDWSNRLTHHFWDLRAATTPLRYPDLWRELEEDPTAIRRYFLVEEAVSGGPPLAFVGAMDLVESLAKGPVSALDTKRDIAERAVGAGRHADDIGSALECLNLVEDRLRRVSFARVSDEAGTLLLGAVSDLVSQYPSDSARFVRSVNLDLDSSWFGRGLMAGLHRLASKCPSELLEFVGGGPAVDLLLSGDLSVYLAEGVAASWNDREAMPKILDWISRVRREDARRTLRRELIPRLCAQDVTALEELLVGLGEEEVCDVFGQLLRIGAFDWEGVDELLVHFGSRAFPEAVRGWARSVTAWSTQKIAHVCAFTYPFTPLGMRDMLCDELWHGSVGHRADVLAAFMLDLGPGRYPHWVGDLARESPELLFILIRGEGELVASQIQKLLSEVRGLRLPSETLPLIFEAVEAASGRDYYEELLRLGMQALVPALVRGEIGDEPRRCLLESPAVASWLGAVGVSELCALITWEVRGSRDFWVNGWRWVADAPSVLYMRAPSPLPAIIAELCRVRLFGWGQGVSSLWLFALRRSRSPSRTTATRLALCGQALKFAFENTGLPLGRVVSESFSDVYVAVTQSLSLPQETAALFGFFDWDKGKELRRELVNAFCRSDWSPGELFLAVSDVHLRQKVFKRLLRKSGGERYARAALDDLEKRAQPEVETIIRHLREMLTYPDFDVEWD